MFELITNLTSAWFQQPGAFAFTGSLAIGVFVLVQIIRSVIASRSLSERSSIWLPVSVVAGMAGLLAVDYIVTGGSIA